MINLLSSLSASCGRAAFHDQCLVCFYEYKNQQNTQATPLVCPRNVESLVAIERNHNGQIYSLPNLHVSGHGSIASADFPLLIRDPYPLREDIDSDSDSDSDKGKIIKIAFIILEI